VLAARARRRYEVNTINCLSAGSSAAAQEPLAPDRGQADLGANFGSFNKGAFSVPAACSTEPDSRSMHLHDQSSELVGRDLAMPHLIYWQVMRIFDQPQRLSATYCSVWAVKLPDLPACWHAVVTALL
jgi:hypothetical protein